MLYQSFYKGVLLKLKSLTNLNCSVVEYLDNWRTFLAAKVHHVCFRGDKSRDCIQLLKLISSLPQCIQLHAAFFGCICDPGEMGGFCNLFNEISANIAKMFITKFGSDELPYVVQSMFTTRSPFVKLLVASVLYHV